MATTTPGRFWATQETPSANTRSVCSASVEIGDSALPTSRNAPKTLPRVEATNGPLSAL